MKITMKRIFSLLLVLVMLGSMLPAVYADEPAEPVVLTDEDYAIVDDVFAKIDAMEDAPAKKNASQKQLTDAAIEIVMASENYVEGSLERNGNCFTWWTDEGIRCIYNPYMREKYENMEAPANAVDSGIYNEPKVTKGGWPSGNQVYVIAPYYGIDDSFTDQYKNEAKSLATAIGDTDGYTLYSGKAATIDAVADAMENGAVVIFDSHGTTDYDGSYVCLDPDGYEVYDYVSKAKYSYLCLTTKTGITTEDYNDGAKYFVDSDNIPCMCVNGAAIANHMEKNSPAGILWMAICLGMATDTFAAPMRAKGVEVVYGYSQSVTFAGDYLYEETFWDNMIAGQTVAQAVSSMKSKWGEWDWSEKIASEYGYSGSGYTLSQARKYRAAFPIVVSDEDVHPGQRNGDSNYGADSQQTVKSTYTLYNQYNVTATTNNTAWGTVSVSGSTITATPATGYFAQSATVTSGTATVTQNGNTFSVNAGSDCSVQINFAAKTAVTVNFSGANVSSQNGYAGDSMSLPTASAPEGFQFLGWTTAPLTGDTTEKPNFYTTSFTPNGNTTLYALYSYVETTSGGGTGDYVKVTETTDDMSGEYLIVYEAGKKVLNSSLASIDASGNGASVTITDNTISAEEGDPYKFTLAKSGSGYSVLGTNGKYISGKSGSNTIVSGTSATVNTISIGATGDASIISNTSHLRFNTSDNRFRYYKSTSYSSQKAVALYVKDGTAGTTYYTSNPVKCSHTDTTNVAAVAATCTENGYTAGVQCNDCQTYISGHEVVAATGHSYGDWTVTTNPTCTASGVQTATCATCGSTTTQSISATGHSYLGNICTVCGDIDPVETTPSGSSSSLQYDFSDYSAGIQYATGENHTLDDIVTLTINGAHLNEQIRLYNGSNAVFASAKEIQSIVVNAGYKSATLNVYCSADGNDWTLVTEQKIYSSYSNYTIEIPNGCRYIMLEAAGAQVRIPEMTINLVESAIQWNVSLGDDIGVNFIMSGAKTVSFTVGGEAVEAVKNGNTYSIALAAAQMTDEILITVDGKAMEETYSVRKYAAQILSGNYEQSTKALVKAMLCYGGAAQTYFGYNTDALASSGITTGTAVPTGETTVLTSDSLAGLDFYGASLVYRDKIAVRFYFTGSMAGLTCNKGQLVQKDDMYYVEVANINPQNLGDTIEIIVTDENGNALSVCYSPLTYMIRMYEKTGATQEMKALVQALYHYYLTAQAYANA